MEIAVVCFPYSVSEILEVAAVADGTGRPLLFGVADSPRLFAECYVCVQHVLANTKHVHVGPFTTNPVTRHWSVQAGAQRSLEELYPGRLFFGLATGDSAVHAFGLKPATAAQLREQAERVRKHAPAGTRLILTAGGLRSAARAALVADDLVVGQGIDPGATRCLLDAASTARESAGIDRPLRPWLYVLADVWPSGAEARDSTVRDAFRSMIMAYSRQALDVTFDGKHVPEDLQPGLVELYSSFSFEDYVGSSHNSRLLDRFAAEEAFVTRRFAVAGPPEAVAEQLLAAVQTTGVDRVWLGLLTRDAASMLRLLVERALPWLPLDLGAGVP